MGFIQNTPVLPSGGTAGTTVATTANSAAGGDAFEHQIGPESASGPTTISSTLET